MQTQTGGSFEDKVPLYAPCRKLSIGDPFRWLKMGWQDFKRSPWHSLAYGLVFVFFGWLLLYLAWAHENNALIVSLLFGFLIMGPVLCFGLYDNSHQLEKNREPTFRHQRKKAFHEMRHERLIAMMMSMLIVFLVIVLSIMIGIEPAFGQSTGSYAVVSLLIAMIFGGLAFCASVFALPMILHQDADGATAILTSINAVLRNKRVLALWALLIFVLTAAGIATALVGLAFTTPVIGYATWHAYRETIITKG
jgi:uncharacterized membrane protein